MAANRADYLKELFEGVDLPEIHGVDWSNMTHVEIAKLLPAYGGKHPMKGILLDRLSGKAYGIASGWEEEVITHQEMPLKSGAIPFEVASQAGDIWKLLGNHVEPVAAAFMRKLGITDASVYINGRNPCWGTPDGTGCYYHMTSFLAEGSRMTVYNKHGDDILNSRPEKKFNFSGLPD